MTNQYQPIGQGNNLPPPQASSSIIQDSSVSTSIHPNGNTSQIKTNSESKKGHALCPWIFKATVIFILVFLEISLIFALLTNSTTRQNGFDTSSGETGIQSAIPIIINKFQALFTGISSHGVIDAKHLTQYRKRLLLGQNMLKKFDDPSGSEAACTGVVKVMIQKALSDDQGDTLHSAISVLNEEESRILADAYLCVGESRLLLFSSSYSTNAMKRSQLQLAKESFEQSVSLIYIFG